MRVDRHPSPNFGPRRDGLKPRLVVVHYTAMESCAAALERLCDPAHEVSAHYLIAPSGEVLQLVDEEMRAWHAGQGAWAGQDDVNSRSVGIEIANDGFSPFAAAAMDALVTLLGGVLSRWDIPAQGVIGHSDMAPGRKCDPGRRFDWRRMALEGVSVWPEAPRPQDPDEGVFAAALARFGYPDAPPEVLLDAFRQRFRPHARGALDAEDMGHAVALADRFPVDPSRASA